MSKKVKESVAIISQECIGTDIYSMWIESSCMAAAAKPGQFISVYTKDSGKLLPRPISICEVDKDKGWLRIVYRVTGPGTGTEMFAKMQAGERLDVLGPLGNGFPLIHKKAFLIGGGIGVPPMLELAKNLNCEKQFIVGYKDETFLVDDLRQYGAVYVATEAGCEGTKGNVMDAIAQEGLEADVIYACGPTPMLRAIKAYAEEKGIECYISMEEKMACGVGACLACVCKTKEVDHHSNVHNKRICKDGPVFLSTEVEL